MGMMISQFLVDSRVRITSIRDILNLSYTQTPHYPTVTFCQHRQEPQSLSRGSANDTEAAYQAKDQAKEKLE